MFEAEKSILCMQKSEDTCSHYRKWLSAVAECAKALTDSKAAVTAAEADVKVSYQDMTPGELAVFMSQLSGVPRSGQ